MEEYKYHLFENRDGDTGVLKAFFDGLSAVDRKAVFSIQLEGGVMTLSWSGWIPPSWRERKEANLPDGSVVQVKHERLDGRQLAPSLVRALRYLAHWKDKKVAYEGPAPEKINEAVDILDAYGLIEGDFEVKFEGFGFEGPDQKLWYSRQLRDYKIAPEALPFLK